MVLLGELPFYLSYGKKVPFTLIKACPNPSVSRYQIKTPPDLTLIDL
jgi:hypothetical protein